MFRSYLLVAASFLIATSVHASPISGYQAWFVMKSRDGTPMMKWSETLTPKDDQLRLELKIWKEEDGVINEEMEGAFAENNETLRPKFFNLSRSFQGSTLQVDGTLQGRELMIKVRSGGTSADRPVSRVVVRPGMILNAFFPVWLRLHHATLDSKKGIHVQTLPEDDPQMTFRPVTARVKRSPKGGRVFDVDYRGLKSRWTLDEDGVPKTIEFQSLSAIAQRVSPQEAAQFFSGK